MPTRVEYHVDSEFNTLYVTGKNKAGQLGLSHKNNIVKFEPSLLKVPVVGASCGENHMVVVVRRRIR